MFCFRELLSKEKEAEFSEFGIASPFPLMKDSPLTQELNAIGFAYFVKERIGFKNDEELTALQVEQLKKMMAVAQKYKDKNLIKRLNMRIGSLPIVIALHLMARRLLKTKPD